jgi:hypothetical protein
VLEVMVGRLRRDEQPVGDGHRNALVQEQVTSLLIGRQVEA